MTSHKDRLKLLLPFLGAAFSVWYVLHATVDVVYSDYIRLVNSYLSDISFRDSFFVPDILTRIPISYPIRWINVHFFGYSVQFDRMLGILGLFLTMLVMSRYLMREHAAWVLCLIVMLTGFGLDKWELLINGSGYAHFLSYSLFFYHYFVLERVFTGTAKRWDTARLCLLPWISLLAAGPYIVQYTATLLAGIAYLWFLRNRNLHRRLLPLYGLCALLPLFLYLLSNTCAIYEHPVEDIGLLTTLRSYPGFSVHFLLNGFASTVLSGSVLETLLAAGRLSRHAVYVLGAVVVLFYAVSVILYFRTGQYRRTIFPLLLLVSGAGSHLLVFLSRYLYLTEDYAWQSRYGMQYLPGTLGLLLIYGSAASYYGRRLRTMKTAASAMAQPSGKRSAGRSRRRPEERGSRIEAAAFLFLSLLLLLSFTLGSCYTDKHEIETMPFRKTYFASMAASARQYESLSDTELNAIFEYHHGEDRVRHALNILKEKHLNVFQE